MIPIAVIRDIFAQAYEQQHYVGDTIEILGATFIADEPTIFGKPNDDYIRRELDWYLTEVPNIQAMEDPIPKIWKDVATEDGDVNSQYGYLVFNALNGEQYNHVLNELRRNPDSRRGTMIYNRPTIHEDATAHGMNDFICTNAVNYFIRDGILHGVVQMRSNDAVFGYRNDWAWQRYVLERLASDLEVEAGELVWQVASLHVYERHYPLIGQHIKDRSS